jgi:hypothetical protein
MYARLRSCEHTRYFYLTLRFLLYRIHFSQIVKLIRNGDNQLLFCVLGLGLFFYVYGIKIYDFFVDIDEVCRSCS